MVEEEERKIFKKHGYDYDRDLPDIKLVINCPSCLSWYTEKNTPIVLYRLPDGQFVNRATDEISSIPVNRGIDGGSHEVYFCNCHNIISQCTHAPNVGEMTPRQLKCNAILFSIAGSYLRPVLDYLDDIDFKSVSQYCEDDQYSQLADEVNYVKNLIGKIKEL